MGFKKVIAILMTLSLFLISLPQISNGYAATNDKDKEICPTNQCLEKPISNITTSEFDNILSQLEQTTEYKTLVQDTNIQLVEKNNIFINNEDSKTRNITNIEFAFEKNIVKDNLVYIKVVFDRTNNKIITVQKIISTQDKDGNISISMNADNVQVYSMTINQDGKIINQSGKVISQEKFYDDTVNNLGENTRGWCEWAMAALCGAGGGAACYAVAAGLGITTGVGGVALATVCGLIGSLGCTAATNAVCG
ncbi:hypothetical protein COE50_26050 [Bacillus anthracis]|nr:hypothetical protein COE50_26050 [Bacillus anthracis]